MVNDELLPALLRVGPLGPSTQTSLIMWPHLSSVGFVTDHSMPDDVCHIKTFPVCIVSFFDVWNKSHRVSTAGINNFCVKSLVKRQHSYTNRTTLLHLEITDFLFSTLMGLNRSTSKAKDCTIHSWLFIFFTDVSFLQDFHVYCNLLHIDKNTSVYLYVGAIRRAFSRLPEKRIRVKDQVLQ